MQQSDTGSGKVWRGRASRATVAAILLASGALAGLPPAYAISPPTIDMAGAWQFGRGAGVKVAVIDTGVSPHPRFRHLIPGGDYVMAGGD